LKRALLIVDRGSREPEVREEMEEICVLVKNKAGYDFADYCFLEVVPPFISDGIRKCLAAGAEGITVMPYFLYPGMKLKDAVRQSAKIGLDSKLKLVIARPLSYHSMMSELVSERIYELKKKEFINLSDDQCDVLLIGHGSSDKNAHDAFVYMADSLKPRYRNVHHCFLELDTPNIEQGIVKAAALHPKVLLIMPYFLHKGAHIKRDVVNEVTAALQKIQFKHAYIARHLGVDDRLVNMILERVKEVENRQVLDGSFGTAASRNMTERAFDIEKRSFEIIDSEIGKHNYNSREWPIVRRVIHATADYEFAHGSAKILFHKLAIESAFSAIRSKCTIVTDVDMVLAAINKKSLSDLGLKAVCYISDRGIAEEAKGLGKTRSEMAMRKAAKEINGGIVVIGNAPTALLEVIEMSREGTIKPSLIVGMPVGFVSAPESKAELAKLDVPFITNVGRKGGSPAASSVINALLLLYQNHQRLE
jgi:precorrin isomerase/sirohydrochlorin ferrochelatase